MKKCAEKQAWDDWSNSDEGESCLDPDTLKLPKGQAQFLVNRIWKAFAAGQEAGHRMAVNRIAREQRKLLEAMARSVNDD
jgi:hypothetical protein